MADRSEAIDFPLEHFMNEISGLDNPWSIYLMTLIGYLLYLPVHIAISYHDSLEIRVQQIEV